MTPADNDALGSLFLPTGTITTKPGGTQRAGLVPPADGYKPQANVGGG
jgi:hypothetical protein